MIISKYLYYLTLTSLTRFPSRAISVNLVDGHFHHCFIEFTKAFDYINRHAMFYKVIVKGVKGKSLKILIDMFDPFTTSEALRHHFR